MHPATFADKSTTIGSGNLFCAYSHIGHECTVGDDCILSNNATLGGHVRLGTHVIIGGLTAVHQSVCTCASTLAQAAAQVVVDGLCGRGAAVGVVERNVEGFADRRRRALDLLLDPPPGLGRQGLLLAADPQRPAHTRLGGDVGDAVHELYEHRAVRPAARPPGLLSLKRVPCPLELRPQQQVGEWVRGAAGHELAQEPDGLGVVALEARQPRSRA